MVFQELMEVCDHPSAEMVLKRVRKKSPNISFDTVNRTLLSFAAIGLIKVVPSHGGTKRFDSVLENHHHFQCVKCTRIIDFIYEDYNELETPKGLNPGLKVLHKKVVLEGVCDRFNQKKPNI
ncbi:MAG: transcriptional repressor [Desulfobulbaceae bacterium]|nr:transcriptional repressor [Desulfobulbaceae bacterium]